MKETKRTLKSRLRYLLSAKIAAVALLIAVTAVAATIFYYYTAKVPVSVEAPKIEWGSGDITITPGTNNSWCEASLSKLQPNATTVYTNAFTFKVLTASAASGMKLQIASATDGSNIIWGIRFYIYTNGSGTTSLTLVEGGQVTIGDTDGGTPVAEAGFYQSGANTNYGTLITSLPADSGAFDGLADTTYRIVIEAYGKDGILTTDTAEIQLRLIWS